MGHHRGGVTTSGRGVVAAPADQATLTVGVSVRRDAAPAAVAAAAVAATAVTEALVAAGVVVDDVHTAGVSLTQEFTYPDEGPRPAGFRVDNTVTAVVRPAERVGAVVDAAVAAGGDATVLQGIAFGLADEAPLRVEARARAFAEAHRAARQFAELAGRDLGPVRTVRELHDGADAGPRFALRAAAAPVTPVHPGAVEVTVTVEARWSFD